MFIFIDKHLIKNGFLIVKGVDKKITDTRNFLSDIFSLYMSKFGGVTFKNNESIYNIYLKTDKNKNKIVSNYINESSESNQYIHLHKMLLGELPYRLSYDD